MYIDAHTHLNSDQLYTHWQTHLSNFQAVGWTALVNIGVNHERNQRAIEIAKTNTTELYIKSSIGVHPWEVSHGHISSDKNITSEIEQLKKLYETHSQHIVAVWECGIDAHYDGYANISSLQKELFFQQWILAREYNLPLVIHSRDHFSDTFEVLQEFTDLKIYFHCRWYAPEEILTLHQTFSQLWIWFCWNTTYPKAQQLRDSLVAAHTIYTWTHTQKKPTHKLRILLETDAPYLSPQKKRWTENNPSHIPHLYDAVSEYLDLPKKELCKIIETNFHTLYTN
jgi:TatD DNase family protein